MRTPISSAAVLAFARAAIAVLVLAWTALLLRRTVVNEGHVGRAAADPYGSPAIIGTAPSHATGRAEVVLALRRLGDAAGDRHEAGAPALIILPAADSVTGTFVLYQLAHLWYPQLVEVRAGSAAVAKDAATRDPAFIYVPEGVAASAPSPRAARADTVARVAPFVALRVTR